MRKRPEERAELLAEVSNRFANPDDRPCSLNLVCPHLGFDPEAWRHEIPCYHKNPDRHALVPNWRKQAHGQIVAAMAEPASEIAPAP